MDNEMQDFLKGKPATKEMPPVNPPKKIDGEAVEKKQQELTLKKLDIELKALDTPNTGMDIWKQMLEMQDKHHKETLELLNDKFDAKLEALESSLNNSSGNETDDLMEWLKIIQTFKQPQQQNPVDNSALQTPQNGIIPPINTQQGGEKVDSKKIISLIKSGMITEAQAWAYLSAQEPLFQKMFSEKEFHKLFEKLKKIEL